MVNIIGKLKKSGLIGRSGSEFPTWKKWELFLNSSKNASKCFVVCNAAEGEPNIHKDEYLLKNYPKAIIEGIKIALKTFPNSRAIIYLKPTYYKKFYNNLIKYRGGYSIKLVKKTGGYLAGEETVLIKSLSGQRLEPDQKPPYPSETGYQGFPTLINNIETFYDIYLISKNKYQKTRFFSIEGEVSNPGVYGLPENLNVSSILKQTSNYPKFPFFVIAGGSLSGEVLLDKELQKPLKGIGSILVFKLSSASSLKMLKKLCDIYLIENCDKCVSCREGIYRLSEMFNSGFFDNEKFNELIFILKNTSFCQLGKSAGRLMEQIQQKISQ